MLRGTDQGQGEYEAALGGLAEVPMQGEIPIFKEIPGRPGWTGIAGWLRLGIGEKERKQDAELRRSFRYGDW